MVTSSRRGERKGLSGSCHAVTLLLLESDPASGGTDAKKGKNNSRAREWFSLMGIWLAALLLEDLLSDELSWSTSSLLLNQGLLCYGVKEAKASISALL